MSGLTTGECSRREAARSSDLESDLCVALFQPDRSVVMPPIQLLYCFMREQRTRYL